VPDLLVDVQDHIATLTLNRPAARNALSLEMRSSLRDALHRLEQDDDVRCVVLRGAGDHFMAGGDVKQMHTMLDQPAPALRSQFLGRIHDLHPIMFAMRRMPKPIVASVAGAAAGAGVSLALACDLVIADADAYFTLAYCRIGTTPDGSASFHLPRAVGIKKALELALLGERIDAASAQAMGMINFGAARGRSNARVREHAETFLSVAGERIRGPTPTRGRTVRGLRIAGRFPRGGHGLRGETAGAIHWRLIEPARRGGPQVSRAGFGSSLTFDLPTEITATRDAIEAFVRREVLPRHTRHASLLDDPRRRYAPDGRYADDVQALIREVRMASAEAGFFNMCVPQSLGGSGLGHLAYFVAWQTVYHTCGGRHFLAPYAIGHWAFAASAVLEHVSDSVRREILPGLLSGRQSMCFGLSEPGAGSDATMIRTRAVADGDGWRISGRKLWTSNSPHADYCIVFAVTHPAAAAARQGGISAFLVPTAAPGFHLESVIRLFGHAGGDEGALVLDDVRVEPEQLIGTLHQGFATALLGVSLGRVYNAARAVGLGRWAIELALAYVQQREAFGHPLAEHQGISFPLAESAMHLHAAHLMGLNAARLLDRGDRAIKELSMAKCYAVEVGLQAVDRAMQAHGGMGLTNEVGLAEAWQTLRIINIADGTNEILRRTILQRLLRGDTDL
jgi:alkylation response protein AidB-like acyl-CoA dehydrogenase/enoyl-CoA hydratase/carnithine racemase